MVVTLAAVLAAMTAATPASAQCWILCGNGSSSPPSEPQPAPVPKPSSSPPPITFGFNDIAGMRSGGSEQQFATMVGNTGAKMHRWAASWGNWEPRANEFSGGYMQHLEDTYHAGMAVGIDSVVQIFGTPRWALDPMARTPGGGRPCRDTSAPCLAPPNLRNRTIRADFKRFVQTLARRFPAAAAFEVWNEPNLQWAWVIEQDPELYAMMVAATKNALREIGSSIPVLTGGLSNTRSTSARSTSLESMLSAVYATAGTHGFDAISFHVYPCADRSATGTMQASLERVRRLKGSRNDLHRPLWITESGASTAGHASDGCGLGFTEAKQGPTLRAVIDWASATQKQAGDLPVLLVHSLLNAQARSSLSTPHREGEFEYGLVAWSRDASGNMVMRQKPAYTDVRCGFLRAC